MSIVWVLYEYFMSIVCVFYEYCTSIRWVLYSIVWALDECFMSIVWSLDKCRVSIVWVFRRILITLSYSCIGIIRCVLGRIDKLFNRKHIPRNNIAKFSPYIFRLTLVLVKSEMKNYNSIQILKLEISKYYNSLVFTVYKRLTILPRRYLKYKSCPEYIVAY